MPQFLRPSADITTANWSRSTGSSDFYTYINEATANSDPYVQTGTTDQPLEVRLSTPTGTPASGDHIIRIRNWMVGSGQPERRTVLLLQGDTTIATLITGTLARTVGAQDSITLTGAEAAAISDYSDLRLQFTLTQIQDNEFYRISWAEMEVPDPLPPVTTRYILIT